MLAIDTLFLDAGGVLVNPAWDRVSAALRTEGIEVSAAALRAAEGLAKKDIDKASTVQATDDQARGWLYFNKVLEHVGVPLSQSTDAALAAMREYHRTDNLWEEVLAGVPDVLAQFRALGLTLVVVSNANGRLRHLFNRLDLTRWFDVVLDSYEWKVEKPDPQLFKIALDQAGAVAERTAHVGDLYHIDVAGARAAGLAAGVLLDAFDLYPDVDCVRVRCLDELVPLIKRGREAFQ